MAVAEEVGAAVVAASEELAGVAAEEVEISGAVEDAFNSFLIKYFSSSLYCYYFCRCLTAGHECLQECRK